MRNGVHTRRMAGQRRETAPRIGPKSTKTALRKRIVGATRPTMHRFRFRLPLLLLVALFGAAGTTLAQDGRRWWLSGDMGPGSRTERFGPFASAEACDARKAEILRLNEDYAQGVLARERAGERVDPQLFLRIRREAHAFDRSAACELR
jgi:hypothetical protein